MTKTYLIPVLVMALLVTSIQAETINCTAITSLPTTITAQGVYCLTGNLATSQASGKAITINANNVIIDLNGWKLGGQGAGLATQAYGIYSTANNVIIKNGIVRGFSRGIELDGFGDVVQNMLVDQITILGIRVGGQDALVEHNQVIDTGGTTVPNYAAVGILAGAGSTVSDNMVSGVMSTEGNGETGIWMGGVNSIARNNIVSNNAIPTDQNSTGILITATGIALNNTVSNFIYCINLPWPSAGIYAYNTVYNCTTNYSGGTAGAGNSP